MAPVYPLACKLALGHLDNQRTLLVGSNPAVGIKCVWLGSIMTYSGTSL